MKFFTKSELKIVIGILIVVGIASGINLNASIRRARDAQRKSDFGSVANALGRFNNDFGFYPLSSSDGKIVACKKSNQEVKEEPNGYFNLDPCDWGNDSLRDPTDLSYPAYLEKIPQDPDEKKGAAYRYISDGSHFQFLVALEGKDEDEYDPKIMARNISCGVRICNAGKADGATPLDKSLKEYENEIDASKK